MSKGKRKRARAESRRLRGLEGGGEGGPSQHTMHPGPPEAVEAAPAALIDRPEHQAQLRAWRDAGCPENAA